MMLPAADSAQSMPSVAARLFMAVAIPFAGTLMSSVGLVAVWLVLRPSRTTLDTACAFVLPCGITLATTLYRHWVPSMRAYSWSRVLLASLVGVAAGIGVARATAHLSLDNVNHPPSVWDFVGDLASRCLLYASVIGAAFVTLGKPRSGS